MNRNNAFKSLICIAAAAVVATAVPPSVTLAAGPSEDEIDIILNGQAFDMKTPPFVEAGVTYLPVRELGQLLGSVVSWHGAIKTVAMTYPELTVRLKQGSTEATVNGKPVRLSTSLKSVNGHIYAPLRFFSQTIGAAVMWDGTTNAIRIGKPDTYIRADGVNVTTWLNRQTGDLYVAFPYEQAPVRAGKVTAQFQGLVSAGTVVLDSRTMLVKLLDHYGEPMVHYDDYSVLVRDGKIADQKKAPYFSGTSPTPITIKSTTRTAGYSITC
ncbi:copper amine oxidase N-terminal domain-containing protein [Paenibacillus xanthanilyticus]|uniref:Copper amine oxidase N-terminal domain-containing protein n=1 Tax=Paenibacillus xanthanilyticus TaxID=1783531 RepID=A0ABV8K921_9BACL